MPFPAVICQITIADDRDKEREMIAVHDVRDPALYERHHGAAENHHDQERRPLRGVLPQVLDGKREDVRPHDGVEQADADNGP